MDYMCHSQKSRFFGDGHPTFNDGILIMGPYKPLRTGSLDQGTYGFMISCQLPIGLTTMMDHGLLSQQGENTVGNMPTRVNYGPRTEKRERTKTQIDTL